MPEVTFLGSHGVANITLVCKNLSIPYCILILNPTRRFIFKFYYYLAAIFFILLKIHINQFEIVCLLHWKKKQHKIYAKRTIPLMQHVIINQMLTSVTKENQHSNKNWSRKKCIDQFFVAILAANSLEVIDSCILYIPNSNAPISYIYSFISIFMKIQIHSRNKQFVSVFK